MLVSDIDGWLLHFDAGELRDLEIGSDLDLDGELERLAANELRHFRAVNWTGVADRAKLIFLDGTGVRVRNDLTAGFVDEGCADALLHECARGLALAEPGNAGVTQERAESELKALVDRRGGHTQRDALGARCGFSD